MESIFENTNCSSLKLINMISNNKKNNKKMKLIIEDSKFN